VTFGVERETGATGVQAQAALAEQILHVKQRWRVYSICCCSDDKLVLCMHFFVFMAAAMVL
jgi:hypothetical protein